MQPRCGGTGDHREWIEDAAPPRTSLAVSALLVQAVGPSGAEVTR